MKVTEIMGRALGEELQAHGVFSIGQQSCVEIIAAVVERAAELERSYRGPPTPSARHPEDHS